MASTTRCNFRSQNAIEDLVHVTKEVRGIETCLDVRGWQNARHLRIGKEPRLQIGLPPPRLHRVALHERVGRFAGKSGRGEREEDTLGKDEASRESQVRAHAI